jgi:tRNA-specific 2-thiouridylase
VKILVAMSGGVDSAVAASLLLDQGHQVEGVYMHLAKAHDLIQTKNYSKSADNTDDAKKIADILNIPLHIWDLEQEFRKNVIQSFLDEYQAGHTPNPCVRCNETTKIKLLVERAAQEGFEKVATGHWARTGIRWQRAEDRGQRAEDRNNDDYFSATARANGAGSSIRSKNLKKTQLLRAMNRAKDQSYVLARIGQENLDRLVLPLGEIADKAEVRAIAKAKGFPLFDKPDSQDICFLTRGEKNQFLEQQLGAKPGPIVDRQGTVLGEHRGYFLYTIGQRTGLKIQSAPADGQPRYVVELDPAHNRVIVGGRAELETSQAVVRDIINYEPLETGQVFDCQIRAHTKTVPARLTSLANQAGILSAETDQQFLAVAAGQNLVGYQNRRVIFSGILTTP